LVSPGHIHGWLSEQLSRLQAAFGTTFIITGGYRRARTSFLEGFWKDVTVCKWFHRSNQKLYLGRSAQKTAKNVEIISAQKMLCDLYNLQKTFNLMTLSLIERKKKSS
jgi:hypothetical protein